MALVVLVAGAIQGPDAADARFGGDADRDGIVDGAKTPEEVAGGSDDDQLIVSIGDSVASGEGNPDVPGLIGQEPRWLLRRCHRSLRSGHAQAALQIERDDPVADVTFVPLGCSGATVLEGLVGPYKGTQPEAGVIDRAQVDRVNDLATRREVDALLVSIGANDVHFSKLVTFCMRRQSCETRRFDPSTRSGAGDEDDPTLAAAMHDAIARLPGLYAQLDAQLSDRVPRDRVLIVEYLDATRGSDGGPCRFRTPLGEVDEHESAWARRAVIGPLNQAVREAAGDHGWRLVGGVADLFDGHGICAQPPRERWVQTLEGSLVDQNLNHLGALHPNRDGHLATAQLIRPALADVLGIEVTGPFEPPCECGEGDGWPLAPWLTVLLACLAAALVALAGYLVGRARAG
jgi:hypothetical protein